MAERYLFPEPAGNLLPLPGQGGSRLARPAKSVQPLRAKAGQQQRLRHNSVTEVPDVE
jgi:hypothetical protein